MARFPVPGSDVEIWDDLLNELLRVKLAEDGSFKVPMFHYEQGTDPGAVGAGKWWINTTNFTVNRRNAANTAWDQYGAPAVSPTPGVSFTWRGSWNAGTGYSINDVVELDGSSYIALQFSTNQNPAVGQPTNIYWDIMALKGSTGAAATGAITLVDLSGFVVTDETDTVISA